MAYIGKTPTAVPLTSGDITNGIITTAKIADDAISAAKLASGVGGKVLQIVQGTHATQVTTTSSSYVTTNLTASITPSSATSKILVQMTFLGDTGPGSGDHGGDFTIFRNSTDLLTRGGDTYYNNNGLNIGMSVSMNYLDSPNTTSSTSYTAYMKARDSGTTMKSCHNNSTGTVVLMEISA